MINEERKKEQKNILNLYACLGDNRYKWGDKYNITAIELDPELAKLYKNRFPNDKVIVTDAHKYLLENYNNFDFIWTSPPCPSHSRARKARSSTTVTVYPDLKLYEEILLLEHYFKGLYCVENVIPYYDPLIPGKRRGRHIYWTNFLLPNVLSSRKGYFMEGKDEVNQWERFHEIDLTEYKGSQRKDKIARNLVDYEAGRTILETAFNIISSPDHKQNTLF